MSIYIFSNLNANNKTSQLILSLYYFIWRLSLEYTVCIVLALYWGCALHILNSHEIVIQAIGKNEGLLVYKHIFILCIKAHCQDASMTASGVMNFKWPFTSSGWGDSHIQQSCVTEVSVKLHSSLSFKCYNGRHLILTYNSGVTLILALFTISTPHTALRLQQITSCFWSSIRTGKNIMSRVASSL